MVNSKDIEKILYMGVGRSGLDNEASIIAKALSELMEHRVIGLTPTMVKNMIESEKQASHAAIFRGAKLDYYEDLAEQGRLIELPCKIGSEVWQIIHRIDDFSGHPYKVKTRVNFRLDMLNDINKTVFLTQEEAEKALE